MADLGALVTIADKVFQLLQSPVLQELRHWKSGLESLNKTVSYIKNMLLDVHMKPELTHGEQGWVDELKEVLYEADDLFDEVVTLAKMRERDYGNLKISEKVKNKADIDSSGTIDYGKFIAATIHLNKLERDEHLVAAFQYFDKDGSGSITIDELQQACQEQGLNDLFLEDIIKEVDQHNDGLIDYGEFVAMMRKGDGGIGRRTMRMSLNMSMRDAPEAH